MIGRWNQAIAARKFLKSHTPYANHAPIETRLADGIGKRDWQKGLANGIGRRDLQKGLAGAI